MIVGFRKQDMVHGYKSLTAVYACILAKHNRGSVLGTENDGPRDGQTGHGTEKSKVYKGTDFRKTEEKCRIHC